MDVTGSGPIEKLYEAPEKSLRYDALCALLTLPDPADLPPRTCRYRYAGDRAQQEFLKRRLAAAYRAYRLQALVDDRRMLDARFSIVAAGERTA